MALRNGYDVPPDYVDDVIERAAIQEVECEQAARPPWISPGAEFLAVEDPPVDYIVGELLQAGIMALLHSEPRTLKTWASEDIAVAVATGTPAFNLERFFTRPRKVLYSSQEDGERLVRQRVKALLRGRGFTACPDTLLFSIHKGINLDSAEWQESIVREIRDRRIQLLVLDPIRRYSESTDKGPDAVRQITGFLRRLCVETGCAVLIVHHDIKPPAQGKDERRRGHRASGGDWFAACEAPISFELAGDRHVVARPESYKLSADPEPFTFRLETDDLRNPTTARLVGEDTTAADAAMLAADESVLEYLANQPGASMRAIMKNLRKGGDTVTESLERLYAAGRVDCVEGPRKSKLWALRATVPTVPNRSEQNRSDRSPL